MQVRSWVEIPLLSLLVGLLGIIFTLGNNQMKNWAVSKTAFPAGFKPSWEYSLPFVNHRKWWWFKRPAEYYYSLIVRFGMTERILPSPCGAVKPITNTHLH